MLTLRVLRELAVARVAELMVVEVVEAVGTTEVMPRVLAATEVAEMAEAMAVAMEAVMAAGSQAHMRMEGPHVSL